MKKFLGVLLAATMTVSLAACGGSSSAEGGEAGEGKPEYVIKYATADASGGITHTEMLAFKERVEAASEGRVEVQIYPDGILGGEREILEGVKLGTINMANTSQGVYQTYDERLSLAEVGFMFDSTEAFNESMDGPPGQRLAEVYKGAGFKVLGYLSQGFRCLGNNVHPVRTPEDLEGLKIRTPEVPALMDAISAMGANPVPISWSESYTALQQGTVDGMECAATALYDSKLHEVLKYLTDINYIASSIVITISDEYFNSLPEDIQQIIVDEAWTSTLESRKAFAEADEESLKKMEEYGVEIIRLTDEERHEFLKAGIEARDKFVDVIGQEEMDEWLSYSESYQ